MIEEHQALALKAAAAMQAQIARASQMQVAIMQGAGDAEIEAHRQAVIAHAEAYADIMVDVARARVRAITG